MTNTNGSRRHGTSPGAPALIRYNHLTFLIINQPTTSTLPAFIEVSLVLHGQILLLVCGVVWCERMSQHSYCSAVVTGYRQLYQLPCLWETGYMFHFVSNSILMS